MQRSEKLDRLIRHSKKVLLGCSLENGAIVAANAFNSSYPKEAKSYFYVWPRDAAFACIAAGLLELDIAERFFSWLLERAEGWQETGLFYEKYHVNGLQALPRLQPDQTGMVLIAAHSYIKAKPEKAIELKSLVVESAKGICSIWNGSCFSSVTNDLWEERLCFPDLKECFSYSVAACIKGLRCANELFPDKAFVVVADEMQERLIAVAEKEGRFFRSFGKLNDKRTDASLAGLIWPFEIIKPNDRLALATTREIMAKLVKGYGVYRYEHDEYDGWIYKRMHRKKGAGFWPLLNFWMSIVLSKAGEKEEALSCYYKAVDSVELDIPEQVFGNDIQKSVSPLCWSHSMFVIASKELGFL